MNGRNKSSILWMLFIGIFLNSCNLEEVPSIPFTDLPVPLFNYELNDQGCATNCTVSFTNTSEFADTYVWQFGDGSPISTAFEPQHTYSVPGYYNVTLTATNKNGTEEYQFFINVNSPPLAADFNFSNNGCQAPCRIDFSTDDKNVFEYEWIFDDDISGDANQSELQNPSHVFEKGGSYEVKLIISNPTSTDEITKTITVSPREQFMFMYHEVTEANTGSGYLTEINDGLTNNSSNITFITSRISGAFSPDVNAVWYSTFAMRWTIFNQDFTIDLPIGAIFTGLVKSAADPNSFIHFANGGNTNGNATIINNPLLNNNPDARVFINADWTNTSQYNNHPMGVRYQNDRWEIVNLDGGAMPNGMKVHVYVNENPYLSFIHETSASSVTENISIIDHERMNGQPNIDVLISHMVNPENGNFNLSIPAIEYRAELEKWVILNQDNSDMEAGMQYQVLAVDYP